MHEGTAVALFREGKTTVTIFSPNANEIGQLRCLIPGNLVSSY